MCGIFCSVQNIKTNCSNCFDLNESLLNHRGPDIQDQLILQYSNWILKLSGHVLWLQGPAPVKQPVSIDNNHLLFNGDIFGGSVINDRVRYNEGDTLPLLRELAKTNFVPELLHRLYGPYSLIFVKDNYLYFARDHYGRRSLLIGYHEDHLILTSVAQRNSDFKFIELPVIGIWSLSLNQTIIENINLTPWDNTSSELLNSGVNIVENFLKIKVIVDEHYRKGSEVLLQNIVSTPSFDTTQKNAEHFYIELLKQNHWQKLIEKLKKLLFDSVRVRVLTQPIKFQNTIGILFSGGLDCTVLAAFCHLSLPIHTEIHLFNVAFEKGDLSDYNTPDRETAIASLKELEQLYPNRIFKLFEINIKSDERDKVCSKRITHLINPLTSVLDDSLGCALWFASSNTESPCRLLVVGMGADELFGGYTRHRNAFRRGGWSLLEKELENDWNNLPHRNLARDDRVISDHGRQIRAPYLDELVVQFVRSLPVWDKCYPTDVLERGIGDKLLLRLLAFELGLKNVACFPKRALQFGSRCANSKENGRDDSPRLLNCQQLICSWN